MTIMFYHIAGVSFYKHAKNFLPTPMNRKPRPSFLQVQALHLPRKFLGTALAMSKEIMSRNDKNCLVALLCASNVSIIIFCMPLRLKYTAYTEFLMIAVWYNVKSDFTVLPENFGSFTVSAK